MKKRLTREQSQARTRGKLLESARVVMAREGYDGSSIERIAEEAGFSKGAFYSNFSSKEEIFLELLETHSIQDVDEITVLLKGIDEPLRMIEVIADWSGMRSQDPSWGMLALDLFRRARRDATFGERHASLFRNQWVGLGTILLTFFPEGKAPAEPEALGGIVFELTYGAASGFTTGVSVRDLVHLALMSLYDAYGKDRLPKIEPSVDAPPVRASRQRGSRSSSLVRVAGRQPAES